MGIPSLGIALPATQASLPVCPLCFKVVLKPTTPLIPLFATADQLDNKLSPTRPP